MLREVQAVIFDLDGVITDTALYHFKAWQKLADKLNIFFDEKVNERLKGIDRINSLRIIFESSGHQYNQDELTLLSDEKNKYYKELIGAMTPKDILPGALQLLSTLKQMKIKIGLASASQNAITVLEKLKIKKYFDYIADASEIKKGKPDPEIFLTVAQNLNANIENCIGVEDARAGIQSIKSAGIYAIGIGSAGILSEADEVIRGLEEFNINKYIAAFSNMTEKP